MAQKKAKKKVTKKAKAAKPTPKWLQVALVIVGLLSLVAVGTNIGYNAAVEEAQVNTANALSADVDTPDEVDTPSDVDDLFAGTTNLSSFNAADDSEDAVSASADTSSAAGVNTSTVPYPENWLGNDTWSEMTQDAEEQWVANAFGLELAQVVRIETIEGQIDLGSGYTLNAKSVGSVSMPCPAGWLCQAHTPADEVLFIQDAEGEVLVTDMTVRVTALIAEFEGTSACTVWYKAWQNDTSNEVDIRPVGSIEDCPPIPGKYVDGVDTRVAEKVSEVTSLMGVPVNSVGHILDGFAVFQVFSAGLGDSPVICPVGYTCVVTRNNINWIGIDGVGEVIPNVEGVFAFDNSLFLTSGEIVGTAQELVGMDIEFN